MKRSSSTSRSRSRLRSYVMSGETDQDGDSADDGRLGEIDEAGMQVVLSFEHDAGRHPERQTHHNPGFDVRSYLGEEEERHIEVKSTRGPWGGGGVGVSGPQFTFAQKLGDQFWLYVVEHALDPEQRKLWTIQNPAQKVTDFMFDDGWKDVAVGEEESMPSRTTTRRTIKEPAPRQSE